MLTRRLTATVAVLTLAGLLAGCGGGGDGDGSDVASLDENAASESDDAPDEGGGDSPRNSQEFQDALLEYAECMRDHGIDMPDPEFSGDGGVSIGRRVGPGGADPADDEQFQADMEACSEEAGLPGPGGPTVGGSNDEDEEGSDG